MDWISNTLQDAIISPTTVLVTVIFTVILYRVITGWIRLRAFLKEFEDAPTPKRHPIFGHALIYPGPNEKGLKWDLENTKKFPKYFLLYIGFWHPIVQIVHPDAAKEILKEDSSKAVRNGGPYKLGLPWLGNSVLMSTGDVWKRIRRLLTPAFHFEILKPYMAIKNDSTSYLINKWTKQCGEDGTTIEILKPIGLMALEILMRCAFTYEGKIQEEGDRHPFVQANDDILKEIWRRAFNPILKVDFIYFNTPASRNFQKLLDYVHGFAEDLIRKRRVVLMSKTKDIRKSHSVDFLDTLLLARDEDGSALSDAEIRRECDTFLFAGHDTTKSAMTWLTYALASHPECQKKAYEEVAAIFKDRDDRAVTLEDLSQIPYLTLCLKESMRLFTTVFMTGRDLDKPTLINDRVFPAGTQVFFNWHAYHHNPAIWGDDHMEFKPERFLHDNFKDMDPYAYLPFAAGPRNCIGQNFALHTLKIWIMRLLLAFEMKAEFNQHFELDAFSVLTPRNGMNIHFTPRK